MSTFSLIPVATHLYIPPITWRGDPKGHIGVKDTFFYVVSGECFVMIDDESFILKAGELAFLPKGKMRTYTAMSKSITMYEINFEFEIDGKYWYDSMAYNKDYYHVKIEDTSYFAALFETSVHHEFNKEKKYDIISFSNLSEIIKIYVYERLAAEKKEVTFESVTAFMKENINRPIKADELAAVACMQTTYFIRKFKEAFGVSPITYLNKLRIYKAMNLMATTNLSIDKIGKAVGIYDNAYFSRVFKNMCSISPLEYKSLLKK